MGFFLFILLFFLFLAFAIVGTVLNFFVKIFSFGRKKHTSADNGTSASSSQARGKVFSQDEGEYVDFEEINE
jgi:mannose/fructose/N-acetylgalactosamine-specific phosphotransferase system component IIC